MAAFCFFMAAVWWALWVFGPSKTPLEYQTYCIVTALWNLGGVIVVTLNRRRAK